MLRDAASDLHHFDGKDADYAELLCLEPRKELWKKGKE
jgi:hypothetical protein